jgi:hypothetical protein
VSKTTQATKKKAGQVKDHVASTLGTSDEKPHKDDEAGSLNLKHDELHLNLTLTLIPNQSYAKMHRLCIEMHMHIHIMHIWAYPSMNAWMCILVRAIPAQIWMSTNYCMTVLLDKYKDEYLKKQIPCMTICISGYYPGSYPEFF